MLKIIFLDDQKCDKYIYVSWNGTRNQNNDFVVFDHQFGSKLGILPGESILVQSVDDPNKLAQCTSLVVRPLTHNDYQLISINSEEIENILLDQLRVFTTAFCKESESNKFNIFPVWLKSSSNVPIFIEICNFEPKNSLGLILGNSTKLVIHSPDENISFKHCTNLNDDCKLEESPSSLRSVFGLFRSILPAKPANPSQMHTLPCKSKMLDETEFKTIPLFKGNPLLLRVLPHEPKKEDNTLPLCSAFISPIHFSKLPEKYCLMKMRQLSTISEKLEHSKKKIDHNLSFSLDTSALSSPDERFNTQFVDKLLRTFDDIVDSFILVMANSDCPEDSIQLNETFRIQRGISATSYVQVAEITGKETSQRLNHFDEIDYLSVPIAKQLTLFPINTSPLNLDSWTRELQKKVKEMLLSVSNTGHLHFTHLFFLYAGGILKIGNYFFTMYFNETGSVDLDRCNWQKLLHNCFFLGPSTEIVVSVVQVKAETSQMLNKWTKSAQELDSTHLELLYNDYVTKSFGGFTEKFDKCIDFVLSSLELKPEYPSKFYEKLSLAGQFTSLLIVGSKGSGKSTFIGRLTSHFSRKYFSYCKTIQCSLIKGKRIESLQKSWSNLLQEVIQRQPSILVFEDLDEIAFHTDEFKEGSGTTSNENVPLESVYCERVAHLLVQVIEVACSLKCSSMFSRISILATAKSACSLNRVLTKANIFNEIIVLSPPDSKQRVDIIEQIVKHTDLSFPSHQLKALMRFNSFELSGATNNYNPEDLTQLIDIAVHNALMSTLSLTSSSCFLPDSLNITEKNVQYALSQFTPAHLSAANLHIHSSRSMADVGGLHQVKQLVLDTILLPVKYPKIFAHLPLKPQNSILLYGMPGTGKTMLVEAIANDSGLNFIGVKGPELLSKYIGASEQSVRDLFARAQAAAPCILFFDEFDSLAPRRGHDSTGVTDRIVNQMLTLLDGLEEMKHDVYILAATSRPDLIDLALLRPGRFDRCVCCALPSLEEKTEILMALSGKLTIDTTTVHLEEVARSTENFTGADLQSLLYTAYLSASKRTNQMEPNGQLSQLVISKEDIEYAIKHTQPSLSQKERTKFALT